MSIFHFFTKSWLWPLGFGSIRYRISIAQFFFPEKVHLLGYSCIFQFLLQFEPAHVMWSLSAIPSYIPISHSRDKLKCGKWIYPTLYTPSCCIKNVLARSLLIFCFSSVTIARASIYCQECIEVKFNIQEEVRSRKKKKKKKM